MSSSNKSAHPSLTSNIHVSFLSIQMGKFLALLLFSALVSSSLTAPTANQLETNLEQLLAEIENVQAAAAEQQTAVKQEAAVAESNEEAEMEQNSLRELLSTIVDSSNEYAQNKLNPDNQGPDTFRRFLAGVLDAANRYTQNKLQPDDEDNENEEEELAEIEQRNFRQLVGYLADGVNNYAQNKLNPDDRKPSSGKQLLGRVLGNFNDFIQQRVQRPRVQEYEQLIATIEQETFKQLAGEIVDLFSRYLRSEPGTDSPGAYEQSNGETEEAEEQVLSAFLAPIAGALLSNLASRAFG